MNSPAPPEDKSKQLASELETCEPSNSAKPDTDAMNMSWYSKFVL